MISRHVSFLALIYLVATTVAGAEAALHARDDRFVLGGPEGGFGDFLGNLSDDARPTTPPNASPTLVSGASGLAGNSSPLNWTVGTVHNISWVVTSPDPVDLLLCSDLQDKTSNNITIRANFKDSSTTWNVTRMPDGKAPPIQRDRYYFLLREANGGPVLIQSQFILATDPVPGPQPSNPPLLLDPTPPVSPTPSATSTGSNAGTAAAATESAQAVASNKGAAQQHLSTGAIVGIAIAATVIAALLLLACVYCFCAGARRRLRRVTNQAVESGTRTRSLESGLRQHPPPYTMASESFMPTKEAGSFSSSSASSMRTARTPTPTPLPVPIPKSALRTEPVTPKVTVVAGKVVTFDMISKDISLQRQFDHYDEMHWPLPDTPITPATPAVPVVPATTTVRQPTPPPPQRPSTPTATETPTSNSNQSDSISTAPPSTPAAVAAVRASIPASVPRAAINETTGKITGLRKPKSISTALQ